MSQMLYNPYDLIIIKENVIPQANIEEIMLLTNNKKDTSQATIINKDDKDETLVLLAIKFDQIKKPSGSIILEFSGNKAINLSVENIEVFLTDIGDPWLTAKKPNHDNE